MLSCPGRTHHPLSRSRRKRRCTQINLEKLALTPLLLAVMLYKCNGLCKWVEEFGILPSNLCYGVMVILQSLCWLCAGPCRALVRMLDRAWLLAKTKIQAHTFH